MSLESQPVRLALIGAGTFASSAHYGVLSSLQQANRVHIHLVWSRRAVSASALAKKYGSHVVIDHAETSAKTDDTNNFKDLSSRELFSADLVSHELSCAISSLRQHLSHLDAVILCVPIPQNAAFTRAVLSLGLHVFCEKPLAHDISSARTLLRLILPQPTPFHAIGENFRFETVFHRAHSLMNTDIDNQLLALTLTAKTPMPSGSRYAFGWRLNQLPDAGILTDGFVHAVAALRILAGADVSTVSAKCSSHASHFEKGCDTSAATFVFDNGIAASVFVSFATAVFEWRLVVVGSKGDIVIERVQGKPGYKMSVKNAEGIQSEEFVPFCGIDKEFEAFVESCRMGKLDERLSAKEAFNDMATVHCMFQSSEEGRMVNVLKPS